MSKDYYKILGIDKNASAADIKSAYRKLSKQYHPDNSMGGDEEKFKEIASAYEVLSDSEKRESYDRYGSDGPQQSGGFGGFDMNDIFSGFGFNPFGSKKQYRKGSDVRININVSLLDILNGVNKKVKYKRKQQCSSCKGQGGTKIENCTGCNGTGTRVVRQQTPMGVFQTQTTCTSCNGSGRRVLEKCSPCNGQGLTEFEDTVSIDVPKGVFGGMTLQMNGKGNSSSDGHFGDLLIHIIEEPSDIFRREDNHIIYTKKISVFDLLTGLETEIEMLDGKKSKLKIDKGTKCDKTYRFVHKGLPNIQTGSMGDFFVELDIDVPVLSNEKLELLKTIN